MLYFVICLFFSKSTFSKNSFRNTIKVSNSLDPDQTQSFVRLDLGRNCLQSYQQMKLASKDLMTVLDMIIFIMCTVRIKIPVKCVPKIRMCTHFLNNSLPTGQLNVFVTC